MRSRESTCRHSTPRPGTYAPYVVAKLSRVCTGLRPVLTLYLLGQGPVEQSSTNKPLAMRVVEDALAYSKKPPVI